MSIVITITIEFIFHKYEGNLSVYLPNNIAVTESYTVTVAYTYWYFVIVLFMTTMTTTEVHYALRESDVIRYTYVHIGT